MKSLTINIICDEANAGWIYSEFIDKLMKYSRHNIIVNEKNKDRYDVCYIIPYYNYNKQYDSKTSACWFSHQEPKNPLYTRFINVAKSVNMAISHSKKYADILAGHGVQNIIQIMPGIDLDKFNICNTGRPENKKLIVGHVGRFYATNRKNPSLLKKISKLPFVDFRATNGKLKSEQVPKFIQMCDIICNPSHYEGGPMSLNQALACGKYFLCMKDVGVANEFEHGIIQANDENDFIKKLKTIFDEKKYLSTWRDMGEMKKMRSQVEQYTWKNFAEKHDKVFEQLIQGE